MPKEGKNERFSRRVCEVLQPLLGDGYEYIENPQHELRQNTDFGYRAIGVQLWGAHAPERHLEFVLGVWHNEYEATRLRLDQPPTFKGALHFWQTTGNLLTAWAKFQDREGRWDANLDEDPAATMQKALPFLLDATSTVFGACNALRKIRDLLEPNAEGALFTMNQWKETILLDACLGDWTHLRNYLQRQDLPDHWSKDPALLERIEHVYGVKCSGRA